MDNQGKLSFLNDRADEQIENETAKADKKQEVNPKVDIKSQENILNGLSDKERAQAAEGDLQNLTTTSPDASASGVLNSGLTEQERNESAEADGKINTNTKGGLSDAERRDAAEESW